MGVEMTADDIQAVDEAVVVREVVIVMMRQEQEQEQEGSGVARSVITVELESPTVREISIPVRPLKQSTMMEEEEGVDHVVIGTSISPPSTAARSIDETIIVHKNESMRMVGNIHSPFSIIIIIIMIIYNHRHVDYHYYHHNLPSSFRSFVVSQIMSKSMMTWRHNKLSSPLRGISQNEARGVAIRS
jgi:hypothetical protein